MISFLKKLQPTLLLLRGFLPEVGNLCLRVGRRVVVPGFGRKGNLLSSLFLLFTGLTEQVIGLARELVLRAPQGVCGNFPGKEWVGRSWGFSRKYLRYAMLVAAWVLFILSSWEWAVPGSPAAPEAARIETVCGVERVTTGDVGSSDVVAKCAVGSEPPVSTLDGPAIGGRRWLRLRVLRI